MHLNKYTKDALARGGVRCVLTSQGVEGYAMDVLNKRHTLSYPGLRSIKTIPHFYAQIIHITLLLFWRPGLWLFFIRVCPRYDRLSLRRIDQYIGYSIVVLTVITRLQLTPFLYSWQRWFLHITPDFLKWFSWLAYCYKDVQDLWHKDNFLFTVVVSRW